MRKIFLILAVLTAGCVERSPLGAVAAATASGPAGPVELTIYAAASLTGAFDEIGGLFQSTHPEARVIFNYAGSQQLAQQIIQGAPADVFASANKSQMDVVIEAGEIEDGKQQVFVHNRLVVIYPEENPAGVKELKDLAAPGLKLVFAAQEVPVGQYSLEFLEKAAADPAYGENYEEDVLRNIVSYEDNVKAVLAKVALGEADAGIVFSSDVASLEALKVGRLDIPDDLNAIASYPIAPVERGDNPELARAFIDVLLSPEGQNLLASYNFIPVK